MYTYIPILLFSSSRSLLNVSCIFSILFPRFWIIFIIITLNSFLGRLPSPLHLVVLIGFNLAPLCTTDFSAISFCLTYCVRCLLSVGCRIIAPLLSGVCPRWVRWVLSGASLLLCGCHRPVRGIVYSLVVEVNVPRSVS